MCSWLGWNKGILRFLDYNMKAILYTSFSLIIFAESSIYLPEQFEESVESYLFCIKCDLRRRQDEGVDLELIWVLERLFSISSVSSKPSSNKNGLLCLCLISGITCAEKVVKFIFHIFVNNIEFIRWFHEFSVNSNLRIFEESDIIYHLCK